MAMTRKPGDLPCAVVLFPVGVCRGLRVSAVTTCRSRHCGGLVGMRIPRVLSLVGAVVWTIALSVCAVAADAAGPAESPDSVEPVVVSATRLPTPELEVASSVTVITAQDIAARQERSLPDILREVPGLN